jgi:hypothetical protein
MPFGSGHLYSISIHQLQPVMAMSESIDAQEDWLRMVAVQAKERGLQVRLWCDGVLVLVHSKHVASEHAQDLALLTDAPPLAQTHKHE